MVMFEHKKKKLGHFSLSFPFSLIVCEKCGKPTNVHVNTSRDRFFIPRLAEKGKAALKLVQAVLRSLTD